jgi:hypothetical protein
MLTNTAALFSCCIGKHLFSKVIYLQSITSFYNFLLKTQTTNLGTVESKEHNFEPDIISNKVEGEGAIQEDEKFENQIIKGEW